MDGRSQKRRFGLGKRLHRDMANGDGVEGSEGSRQQVPLPFVLLSGPVFSHWCYLIAKPAIGSDCCLSCHYLAIFAACLVSCFSD